MVSYPNFLQVYFKDFEVLILIVVEDDLVRRALTPRIGEDAVLILVVVEDGLVPLSRLSVVLVGRRLLPSCRGRWSRT